MHRPLRRADDRAHPRPTVRHALGLLALSASVAAGSDAAAQPPARDSVPVVRFRTTEDSVRVVWVGDTLVVPLPPDPLPASAPDSLRRRGRRARFRSYAPEVASIDTAGVAVARAAGDARLEAWTPLGARVLPVHVRPAVRGRVVAPDDPAPRARVIVRRARGADTVRTDAHGRFLLPLGGDDYVGTVRVEPAGVDSARWHAAVLHDPPAESLGGVRVALVPRRWTVRGGTYDGTVVAVEPALAAAAVRERGGFFSVARTAGHGGWPVGWPAERFPLPLTFAATASEIGAVDSAIVWTIARQLERDWGGPLFRPAPRAAADSADFSGIAVRVDPTIPSAGFATTSWTGTGDLSVADVRVRNRWALHDPRILTHELLHALGLGHATGWTSVMTARGSVERRMSATDVAYAQLVAAMRRVQREADASYGIGEAETGRNER